MVRYTPRPWYSPLGFMASAPTSYGPLIVLIGVAIAWPFRYSLSEYFERQKDGPHVELRQRAVKYYNELERMHRRQAQVTQFTLEDDNLPHRNTSRLVSQGLRYGQVDDEQNYWSAHQADAIRAEKLLAEVRELKKKVAASSSSS